MIRSWSGRGAGLAIVLLALTACREETGALPPAGESKVAAQQAACVEDGGRWGESGRPGIFVCYRPTRDANTACTKDGDCQGFCLARSRTCAPVTPLYGCNDVLGATGARSTVCVQ
jgi:hypothetical protein